jgi:AcrR family transcriptional regulator
MSKSDDGKRAAGAQKRRTQSERSEATKLRVLEAAARLIARNGYAELRVADIAAEAGVSVGAQLHHFPTKDALVLAVIEHCFSEAGATSRRRAAARADAGTVLRDLIADAKDFFFSEHFLIAINIVLSTLSPSGVGTEVLEISRRARLPVEEAWGDALLAAGFPAELTNDVLTLTLCIVRGFSVRRLWDDDKQSQERCLSLWRDMVHLLLERHCKAQAAKTRRAAAPAEAER